MAKKDYDTILKNGANQNSGNLLLSKNCSKDKKSSPYKTNHNDFETSADNVSLFRIACILSTATFYGCITSTLFLLVLPVECSRMANDDYNQSSSLPHLPETHIQTKSGNSDLRSTYLVLYALLTGVSQILSPWIGVASDHCHNNLGKRRPFLVLGTYLGVFGLVGQWFSRNIENPHLHTFKWILYSMSFCLTSLSLNLIYVAMIALIPDLVPSHQTGMANGILSLLVALGALVGFCSFHYILIEDVNKMYIFYIFMLSVTSGLSLLFADEQSTVFLSQLPTRSTLNFMGIDTSKYNNIDHSKTTMRLQITKFKKLLFDAVIGAIDSLFSNIVMSNLRSAYWLSPREHHNFFVIAVSRTFYYMGISLQTYCLYFLHDIPHNLNVEDEIAILPVIGCLCLGAITAYPIGYLSDYIGNVRNLYVKMSCTLLAVSVIALIGCNTLEQVMVLSVVIGGANGSYLAMGTSIAIDTLPNREDTAHFLGIWRVAGLVGSIIGPVVGILFLMFIGSVTNTDNQHEDHVISGSNEGQQTYAIQSYEVLMLLSAIYFCCSALSLQ